MRIGLLFSSQVSSSRDHLLPSSGSNCSALAAQRRARFGSQVEVRVEKDGGEGEKYVQDDLTSQLPSSYVRSVHDTLPHASALCGQSPTFSLRRGLFMCADLLTSRDRIARVPGARTEPVGDLSVLTWDARSDYQSELALQFSIRLARAQTDSSLTCTSTRRTPLGGIC